MTVFTTVGFGDIAAKSETARFVLIVQMLADLALLVPPRGCRWAQCTGASSEDPAQAMATARPLNDNPACACLVTTIMASPGDPARVR